MSTPGESNVDRHRDAIAVEIFANLFRAIVDEMTWIVRSSAHTTFVKETQDFGTALVTPAGEQFAIPDSTGVTALVGIPMAAFVDAISEWHEGDVALTNDPYATKGMVTHLSDVFVLRPIFVDGRLFCFAWAFLHCSDVGGNVPGSIDSTHSEIFQEGLRLSPTKIHRRGVVNQTLIDVIASNCRSPALNWGDITAVLASLEVAEARVKRLAERYGRTALEHAMHATLDRTEMLTRAALKEIPAGTWEFTEYLEDDFVSDTPVRFVLRLTSRGDGTVVLDYTGSDPQLRSAVNFPAGGQRHHPMLSLAVINFAITNSAALHVNAGIVRCIDLVLPEASVVNCSFPAACGARVITSMRAHEATLGALAMAMPGRVPAGGASQLAITSISTSRLGSAGRVVVANPVTGGSGGGLGLDGVSGTDIPTAALRNVPVEVLESESPILVHRFELRRDSEGAGQFRGGFGIEYAFEVTAPHTTVVTRGKDRHRFGAWGSAGGRAATTSSCTVVQLGGGVRDLGKQGVYLPQLREVIVITGGGGGGHGPPHERDPESVLADVRSELVTRARARDAYGVVITDAGALDSAATARLRERMRLESAGRGFDFGPGREAWERDWGEAFVAIADWVNQLPAGVGRREAQERAYAAVRRETQRPVRAARAQALIAELAEEWGITSGANQPLATPSSE